MMASVHRDEVYEIVGDIIPTRTTAEWQEIFDGHKLWCGPVYDYAALAADPHVQATGMLTSVEHPTHGELRMPSPPLHLSETPPTVPPAPPILGAHTERSLPTTLATPPSASPRCARAGPSEMEAERMSLLSSEDLLYSVEGAIARITLQRPQKLNTVTAAMGRQLFEIAEEINGNDAVRVAILAGDR